MLLRARGLVLLLAALGGCTGDTPADGGIDAGRADVGRDGGRDAARPDAPDAPADVGRDAPDAPFDGGPDDPGWVPLPGLPEDCAVARATHPERLPATEWNPCEGGPPGCLRNTDATLHEAWAIGGEIWISRWWDDGRVEGLARIDAPPVAAWRDPPAPEHPCGVYDIAAGGANAAVAIVHESTDFPETSGYSIYAEERSSIGAAETPRARWLRRLAVPTNLHVSDDAFMYRETSALVPLYRFDGTWVAMNRGVPGVPDPVMLVGDHVLWQAWTDVSRLAHGSFDIPGAVFRDAAPDELRGLSTDGDTIVWQQAIGFISTGFYERVELWAAPYTRDVAALAPRFVRVLENLELGRVGGRWYAFRDTRPDPDEIQMVDLTDGSRRTFVPPGASNIPDDPILVSDDQILVRTTSGSYRIDPRELPVEP